jgi:Tfp pilus assembly protein PilV
MVRAGSQRGFSIVEILIGFFVLSIAFVSLGAYTTSQRSGLHKSNQLSDGTQAAASALEEMKRELSDSATFRQRYDQTAFGSLSFQRDRTLNHVDYGVTVTLTRGPSPDYLLKARARATWKGSHAVEFGVLVPGASDGT